LGSALTLTCLDLIKDSYFEFLKSTTFFLHSIFLLSGIRLIVIIVFGWLCALGLCIGYFSSGVFVRDFSIEVALASG
jgi:hypothetical protein